MKQNALSEKKIVPQELKKKRKKCFETETYYNLELRQFYLSLEIQII